MPDAAGNIKGIAVPEIPWLREYKIGERVRNVVDGSTGTVSDVNLGAHRKVLVALDGHRLRYGYYYPGELRPV